MDREANVADSNESSSESCYISSESSNESRRSNKKPAAVKREKTKKVVARKNEINATTEDTQEQIENEMKEKGRQAMKRKENNRRIRRTTTNEKGKDRRRDRKGR